MHPQVDAQRRARRFLIGGVVNGTYRVGVASSSSGPAATMRLAEPITITVADGNVGGLWARARAKAVSSI